MKKIQKTISLLLATVFCGGLLAACDGEKENDDGSGKVTLKIWAPQEEQEVLLEMCDQFSEKHPDYNIAYDFKVMGVDASVTEIKKDYTVAGDIFLFPSGAVPELVRAGYVLPITLGADTIRSEQTANAVAGCTFNEYLYAVPTTPNNWFMYYNKSVYKESDVLSLETMMAKNLGGGVTNFSMALADSWYNLSFFVSLGCTLFGADGEDSSSCTFNDANGLKAGQYMIDLANNPKFINDEDGLGKSMLCSGTLGAFCSGDWEAKDIKAALGDNYGACKLPTINVDGKDVQLQTFGDYKAYGVNSATKHAKEAIELAAWLGGTEAQLYRFETNGTTPTVKSLISLPSVMSNAEVTALMTQDGFSLKQPTSSRISAFWEAQSAFGAEVVNKTVTSVNLQEKLDKLVEGITSSIA